MRANQIAVGDRLKLKRDNYYGFGPLEVEVIDIVFRSGYKVPWIRGRYGKQLEHGGPTLQGSFKPSDFAGRV